MRPASMPSVVLRGTIHKNKDIPRNDMNKALHLVSTPIQNNQLLVDSKPLCPSRLKSTSSHMTDDVAHMKNHNIQTDITLNRNFHRKAKPNSKMKIFTEGPPFPSSSNSDKNHGDYVYNEIWASKRRFSFSTDILFNDMSSKDVLPKVAQDWPEDLLNNWNGNVQISLDDSLKSGLTADSVIKEFQSETSVKNKNAASSSKNRTINKNVKKSKSKRSLSKQLKVVEKRSVNYYMKKTLANKQPNKNNKNDKLLDKRTGDVSPFKLKPCSISHKSRALKKSDDNSVNTSSKYNEQSAIKPKVNNLEVITNLDSASKVNNIELKDVALKADIANSKLQKSEDIDIEKSSHIIVLNEGKTCSNLISSNALQNIEKVTDKSLVQTDIPTLESNAQITSQKDVSFEPSIFTDQNNIPVTETPNKEINQDSLKSESYKNFSSKLSPEGKINQIYESVSLNSSHCDKNVPTANNSRQKSDGYNLQLSSNQYLSETKSLDILSEFSGISASDNITPTILPSDLKFSNFDISENISTNVHSNVKSISGSEISVEASSSLNELQNNSTVSLKASPSTIMKNSDSENDSSQSVTNEVPCGGKNVSTVLPPKYLTTISSQIEQLEYILSNDVKTVSNSEIDDIPKSTSELELSAERSMMESSTEILPNSEQSMQEFLNRKVYCVPNFNTDVFIPSVGADFIETSDLAYKNPLPPDNPKVVSASVQDFLQGSCLRTSGVLNLGMQESLTEDNSKVVPNNLSQESSTEAKVVSTNNDELTTGDKTNSPELRTPKPRKIPANNVKKNTSFLPLKTKIMEKSKEKGLQESTDFTKDKENIYKPDNSQKLVSTTIENSIKQYLAAVDLKIKSTEEENLLRLSNELSKKEDADKEPLITLQKDGNTANVIPLKFSSLKKDVTLKSCLSKKDQCSKKDIPLKSSLLKCKENPENIHLKSSLKKKIDSFEKVPLKSSLLKKDETYGKEKNDYIKSCLLKKGESCENDISLTSYPMEKYETPDKAVHLNYSLRQMSEIPEKEVCLNSSPMIKNGMPIKNNSTIALKIVSNLENSKCLLIVDKEETKVPESQDFISKSNEKSVIQDNLLMESSLLTSLKTPTCNENPKNNLKLIDCDVLSKSRKSLPSIYLRVFSPYEKEPLTSAEILKEKVVVTSTNKKMNLPSEMNIETKTCHEHISSFEKKLLNKSQDSIKLKKPSHFKGILYNYALNSYESPISKDSSVTELSGDMTVNKDEQNSKHVEMNLTKKASKCNYKDGNKDKKLANFNLSKSLLFDNTDNKMLTKQIGTETSIPSSYERPFAAQNDEKVTISDLFNSCNNTSLNLSNQSLGSEECLLPESKSSNKVNVCHPYQKFLDFTASDNIFDPPSDEINVPLFSENTNKLLSSHDDVISQTIENNISLSQPNSKSTLSLDMQKKTTQNEIKSISSDREMKLISEKNNTIPPEKAIKDESKLSEMKYSRPFDDKIFISDNKSSQVLQPNSKSEVNRNLIPQNKNLSLFNNPKNDKISMSSPDNDMSLLASSLKKSLMPFDNRVQISALSCLKSPFSRKAMLPSTNTNINDSSDKPKRIKGLTKKETLNLISKIGQNSVPNKNGLKGLKNHNFEHANMSIVHSNDQLKKENEKIDPKHLLCVDLKSSKVDKSSFQKNIGKTSYDVIPEIDEERGYNSLFYCKEKKSSKTIKASRLKNFSFLNGNSPSKVKCNYDSETHTVSKGCDNSHFDDKSGHSPSRNMSDVWETNNSEQVEDIFDNPYHMTSNQIVSNQTSSQTNLLEKLNLDKKPESYLVVSKTPSTNGKISLLERTNLIIDNCFKDLNLNPVVGKDFSIEKKISLSIELINHSSNCKNPSDSMSSQKILGTNDFKDVGESKSPVDKDRNVNVVFNNGIFSMHDNQVNAKMESNCNYYKSSVASHKKSCREKVDLKKLKSTKLNEKEITGVLKRNCRVRANNIQNLHNDVDDLKMGCDFLNPSVPSDLMRSLLWKYKKISEKMVNEMSKYRVRAISTRYKGYCKVPTKSSISKNYYRVRAQSDRFDDGKDKFEPSNKNHVTNKSKISTGGSGDASSKEANNCNNSTSFVDPNIWKYVLLFRSIPLKLKKDNLDITDIKELPDVSKRSVLDLFRSVDKSTVIIQKDFYTREKIMKRIKDEENKFKKQTTPIDKTVKAKQIDLEISPEQKIVIENHVTQNVSHYNSNVGIDDESKKQSNQLGFNTSTDSGNLDRSMSASQNEFKFLRYDAFFSKAIDPHATEAYSDGNNAEISNSNNFFSNYPKVDIVSLNSNMNKNELLLKRRNIYKNIVVFNSDDQSKSVEGLYLNYRDNINEIKMDGEGNIVNSAASKNNNKSDCDGIKVFNVASKNVPENSNEYSCGSPTAKFAVCEHIASEHVDTTEGIVEPLYSEHALIEPAVSYAIKQSVKPETVTKFSDSEPALKKESASSEVKPKTFEQCGKPETSQHALPEHGPFHTVYSQHPHPKEAHSKYEHVKSSSMHSIKSTIPKTSSKLPHSEHAIVRSASKTDSSISEQGPEPSEKLSKFNEEITSSPVQNTTTFIHSEMPNTKIPTSSVNMHVSPEYSYNQDAVRIKIYTNEASSKPELKEKHDTGDFMNQPKLNETAEDYFKKTFSFDNNSKGNLLIKLKEDGNDALDISSYDVTFYDNPNKGFSILLSDDNIDIDIASLIKANDPSNTKEIVAKGGVKDLTTNDENFVLKETRKPPSSFPFPQTTSSTSINLRTIDTKTEVSVAQNSNTLEPGSSVPSVVKSYFQMSGCSAKLKDQASIVETAKKNLMGLGGITEFKPISKITGKTNMLNISSGDSTSINNLKISSGAYSVTDSKKENESGPTNAKREYELSSSSFTDDIKPVVTVSNDYPVINIQLQLAGKGLKPNPMKDLSQEDMKPKMPPPNQTDSYEDTIEKMRKKFITNTFRPDSSVAVNRLNPKVEDPKVPKTLQDEEEKKPKIDNFEYDPNSNPLNEKDLKLLENYFYSKNNPNKKSSPSKAKKSSKYSLGKSKGMSGKKSKIDPSSQVVDSVSKFKELIEKYANDNYMELSQYTFSVVSPSEFANAPRPSSLNKVAPIADVSEQTIASFSNLRRYDKESGFSHPMQGIINIDLLANPILKEKFAAVPSVSRILNDTMSDASRTALDKWKMRMLALMGETAFQEFYQAQLDQGKDFHESVKGQLMGRTDLKEKHKDNLCLKSIEWVLKDISDVAAVESFVVHPSLGYKGIFDCVAKYKEKPVLIEWKHSNKKKSKLSSTYDAPLQMTAYMGALSEDKNYNLQVDSGLVVVAHADGSPAELFEINMEECQKFWTLWLQRLARFVANYVQKAPTP